MTNWVIKSIDHWGTETSSSCFIPFHTHNNILSGLFENKCIICSKEIPKYIQFQVKLFTPNRINYIYVISNIQQKEALQFYPKNKKIIPYYFLAPDNFSLGEFSDRETGHYDEMRTELLNHLKKYKKSTRVTRIKTNRELIYI